MTPEKPKKALDQPGLSQLLTQFIRRRAADQAGTRADLLTPVEEVVPFQAAAVHPVDPTVAFQEGVAVASYLLDGQKAMRVHWQSVQLPPEWPTLVRSQEPLVAVPWCLGNFPQLVRDVTPLLTGTRLSELRPRTERPVPVTGLVEWADQMVAQAQFAEALLGAAALRLAHQFDSVALVLEETGKILPAQWQGLLANEQAALAWQQGDSRKAAQLWGQHPQADSPVLLFNRGMAALFTDKATEAVPLLTRVADALPEHSAWHHLARLYLTAAQSA